MSTPRPGPSRPLALAIALVLDGLLGVGFGVGSWAVPVATVGTIVDLSGAGPDSLLLATFGHLSMFYLVVGWCCLVAATLPIPFRSRIAAVMALSHAGAGAKGVAELGRGWLIGDPWPDLIIHAAFVLGYAACLSSVRMWRIEPAP